MRSGRIDALKYTVEYAHTHVCEQKSARGKIIIILRKQSTLIRSFVRSQILCARDNYANTLPRWLVLRADNDKTQILTLTVLKRENKADEELFNFSSLYCSLRVAQEFSLHWYSSKIATVIHGGQPPRGGSIDPPSDTETSHPSQPGQLQPSTLPGAAAREQSIRFTWIRRVCNLWITPKKLMKAPPMGAKG
ncbi:hypothetical protein ALC53_13492 [Atta colombica]|uniref:Uncharacterized protein n=1 Tax=Atta colombica TaxID=520822 RepID=A0A195AVC2_9HYME|nr:hypothetical protein ALC53_13492 [Atta colombica]